MLQGFYIIPAVSENDIASVIPLRAWDDSRRISELLTPTGDTIPVVMMYG